MAHCQIIRTMRDRPEAHDQSNLICSQYSMRAVNMRGFRLQCCPLQFLLVLLSIFASPQALSCRISSLTAESSRHTKGPPHLYTYSRLMCYEAYFPPPKERLAWNGCIL